MSGRWSGGLKDGTKILIAVFVVVTVIAVVFGL